jgi:hypothetical protein
MTILNLFGLYTAAHIDWCVGIEHQLVKQRDIRILGLPRPYQARDAVPCPNHQARRLPIRAIECCNSIHK